jgi:uncharacterized membrane protein
MNKILDNRERAKNTIIAFWVMLGVYVVILISDFMEYRLLSGDWMRLVRDADANDTRQVAIALFAMVFQIVLIVLFIQWFRRAYHNLHKAGEKGLVASEGWAAGYWFIPIANWFMPYQIMRDIWNRTKKYGTGDVDDFSESYDASIDGGADAETSEDSLSVVNIWWAFWIISGITSTISIQITNNASEIGAFQMASLIGLISDVAAIVAIFLAVRMIKNSQIHQNRFFRAVKNKDQSTFGMSDSDEILD